MIQIQWENKKKIPKRIKRRDAPAAPRKYAENRIKKGAAGVFPVSDGHRSEFKVHRSPRDRRLPRRHKKTTRAMRSN